MKIVICIKLERETEREGGRSKKGEVRREIDR